MSWSLCLAPGSGKGWYIINKLNKLIKEIISRFKNKAQGEIAST